MIVETNRSATSDIYSRFIRRRLEDAGWVRSYYGESDISFHADIEYAHGVAMERLMEISSMPLSIEFMGGSGGFRDAVRPHELLEQLRLGVMTTEQFVSELQSKASLYLMEQH